MKSMYLLVLVIGIVAGSQEITYFSEGYDQAAIATLNAAEAGKWTGWMNRDSGDNTGEYEQVSMQHRKDGKLTATQKMICSSPVAMTVISAMGYDIDEINQCTLGYTTDPSYGYSCNNWEQSIAKGKSGMVQYSDECKEICARTGLTRSASMPCGKCPDVKVKYFCEGTEEDFTAYLGTAKRDLDAFREWEKRQMKRVMEEELQQEEEKREEVVQSVEKDDEKIESLLKKLLMSLQ